MVSSETILPLEKNNKKREKKGSLSFSNSTRKNTYILYYIILHYSYCRLTREREREVHNQHKQQCAVRYGSWVADGGNGTRTVRTTSRTVYSNHNSIPSITQSIHHTNTNTRLDSSFLFKKGESFLLTQFLVYLRL